MELYLKECIVTNDEQKSEYPFSSPLYQKGFEIAFDKNLTFLVGENGVGKSTFLESLAAKIGFSAGGGNKDHVLRYESLGRLFSAQNRLDEDWEYMRDNMQNAYAMDNLTLQHNMRLVWRIKPKDGFFFRAESYLLLTELERFGQCRELSHGEGIIQMMSGFKSGVFLLDEPESGLAPSLQLRLIFMMEQLMKDHNAQFIVSTHSPILMAYPHARLLRMTNTDIAPISFDETPHYQLTKRILADPISFFKQFSDDE